MTKLNDSKCVFIGKPCDVAALRKLQMQDPVLKEKIDLAISIFCAGTPSTIGTHKVLESFGVRTEEVEYLRYRGYGWPGKTAVKIRGSNCWQCQTDYEETWGEILSKYVQPRCRLCPDSTGELADISCGDAWHYKARPDEPGRSLVLVRTERGKLVLHRAIEEGYVILKHADWSVLLQSQKALLRKRQQLWGRLLAMRMMQIPIPQFKGFSLFANWRDLPVSSKAHSVAGTFKRILQRKWTKPLDVSQEE
jgi:coenzyme F420 hydrogenase subunit beta